MAYNELFARTELLVGAAAMERIASSKVILFGVAVWVAGVPKR